MNFKYFKLFISIFFIFLLFPLTTLCAEVENIGIGGGGVFIHPMINPTDSENLIVSSDMGGVYYSLDGGEKWNRSETYSAVKSSAFSPDGIAFFGEYGLYKSCDKGATLTRIYPKEVKYSVRRMGRNEILYLSDDYTNSLVTAIAASEEKVYFALKDWYDNVRIFSSSHTGDDLTLLYKTTSSFEVDNLFLLGNNLFFSLEKDIFKLNLLNLKTEKLFSSPSEIKDFEKVGSSFAIIASSVLVTDDFINFKDITAFNTLPTTFKKWGRSFSFDYNFDLVAGQSCDNLYLTYHSYCEDYGYIYGVVHFDKDTFRHVFDPIFETRENLTRDAWTYKVYGPIYGIFSDTSNPGHILLSNIETLFDITFSDFSPRVTPLHCIPASDNTYKTSGLNCQSTHSVRVDPFNESHILIPSSDMGLQISYNNGISWQKISTNGDKRLSNCYDAYFDKKEQNKIYGIFSSRNGAPFSLPSASTKASGGFAVSTDGGNTWKFSSSLPENSIPVRMSVREEGDLLYIAVATLNNGFFISLDSGTTFSHIDTIPSSVDDLTYATDVLLTKNDVYCLTAFFDSPSPSPSRLYRYSLSDKSISEVDLGELIIANSLTCGPDSKVYLNVLPYYRYSLIEDINDSYWVNYGGGIYTISSDKARLYIPYDEGIADSIFSPSGTLYAISVYGKLLACKNNTLTPVCDNLFNRLKTIHFELGDIYITTRGGGTYRISHLPDQSFIRKFIRKFRIILAY